MLNIVCVKWGSKYPAFYVNRLYRGVKRWLNRDFRFLCFTDEAQGIEPGVEAHPLPNEPFADALRYGLERPGRKGAWPKISLFKPGLAGMKGQILGFDLDVIITGPLDDIVDYAPERVAMRHEWRYERWLRHGGHGSVFCLDPHRHPYLYDDFSAEPFRSIETYKGSEQYYTSMRAMHYGQLEYLPGNMVCSFKRNSIPLFPLNYLKSPVLPKNCRVMCFHGKPKIEEAISGYNGSMRRHSKPCPWIRSYWMQESSRKLTSLNGQSRKAHDE